MFWNVGNGFPELVAGGLCYEPYIDHGRVDPTVRFVFYQTHFSDVSGDRGRMVAGLGAGMFMGTAWEPAEGGAPGTLACRDGGPAINCALIHPFVGWNS